MANTLIVIEGLDGSGKSTQVELLKKRIAETGLPIKQIKLPDYDDESSTLVKMYLKGDFGKKADDVNIYAASSFYAVDRFASYKRHWMKDYLSGTVIIADRYTTSNAVHQTVKLPENEWDSYLSWLTDYEYNKMQIPEPTVVIYLDMPVEISQRLMTQRYGGNEQKKDIHEADVEYLKKCRRAAIFASEKFGWSVIKCSDGENPLPIDEISNNIYAEIMKKISL